MELPGGTVVIGRAANLLYSLGGPGLPKGSKILKIRSKDLRSLETKWISLLRI